MNPWFVPLIGNCLKQIGVWILLIALCLPLAGCWDQKELQNRHFALAVAIDAADGSESAAENFIQPYGGKQFRMSVELLDFEPSQSERGRTSPIKTYVVSNTGRSFFEMNRDMTGQLGKTISWEHIQAIVISEAALEAGGLDQLIDWFLRDNEMRWRMRLYITPGEAKSIIKYKSPSGEPAGIFLANAARNAFRNPHIVGINEDIGFTSGRLDKNLPLVLPKIELTENIIKLGGAAIIGKTGRLAAYLNDYDTMAEKFILGLEKGAVITTRCTAHPDYVLLYELFRHDTRLRAHVSGDNIYYTLDITMYGNIGELQRCPEPHDHANDDPEYVHKLELQFAKEVKQMVEHGLKVQQDMGIDVLSFGRELKIRYPGKWEEVKDRWDQDVFPTIPMVVSVNVNITRVGEHK
ncbi:Ger(x)C family spore germination protein [Sporomusa sp.]|uniref:Ger(x)C family spore germination protein n=1 Tax=Sporomusa sp. TaxID=2078658 RepID=UPI002CABD95F|nr:Ger(x)C family spore germination protein [Sporomusa sp.]HWR09446.1 Ger(x)C family spore germination protein [Sporomusa sp.]